MKLIGNVTEDEMVSIFLKGEIDSPRFGPKIKREFLRSNQNRSIVDAPDFGSSEDCIYRRNLLGATRGYPDREIFENFPTDVIWHRVLLNKTELEKAKYINYDYWVELSGGTRLPRDAARNIRYGVEMFEQSNAHFLKAAEFFKKGDKFPDLIFVSENQNTDPIILEGHLRMTAMMLEEASILPETELVIGFSGHLSKWALF